MTGNASQQSMHSDKIRIKCDINRNQKNINNEIKRFMDKNRIVCKVNRALKESYK